MARAPAVMKHFPFFLAVAEEQSFHRAALRLNIAQSALSRRIADLERELATPCCSSGRRAAPG